MCGIAGIVAAPGRMDLRAGISGMVRTLAHRGPDGYGSWISEPVALGHTRLAIIDPAGGQQPMSGAGQRAHITFNARSTISRPSGVSCRLSVTASGRARTLRLSWPRGSGGVRPALSVCRACMLSPSGIAASSGCFWRATISASSHTARRGCGRHLLLRLRVSGDCQPRAHGRAGL